MKHVELFFYFLSYTSGFGCLTLAAFLYLRSRNITLKYAILADLFLTLNLAFDTLNFYTYEFIQAAPVWAQLLKIGGLLTASVGLVYFLLLTIGCITVAEFTTRKKRIFLIVSTGFLVLVVIALLLLYEQGVVTLGLSLHLGFYLSNLFTSVGSLSAAALAIRNWQKIDLKIRKFLLVLIAMTIVFVPISVLSNFIQFKGFFDFPLAFSPVFYFVFNLAGIFFIIKNISVVNHPNAPGTGLGEKELIDMESLRSRYELTDREMEIIGLVLQGLSNQEIGAKLFISSNTARNHIYNIYRKIGVKNRYELITLVTFDKK